VRDGLLDTAQVAEAVVPFERMRSRMHSAAGRYGGLPAGHELEAAAPADETATTLADAAREELAQLGKSARTRRAAAGAAAAASDSGSLTAFEAQYDESAIAARHDAMVSSLRKLAASERAPRAASRVQQALDGGSGTMQSFNLPSDVAKQRRARSQRALDRLRQQAPSPASSEATPRITGSAKPE
jgi:hypothetical protein